MQEAVAVTTAIQEEIFLEMGIGKFYLQMPSISFIQMMNCKYSFFVNFGSSL